MIQLKHLLTEAAPLSANINFRKKVKEWEGPGPVDANKNHLAYDDKNPGVAAKPGVLIRGKLTIGYGTTDTVLPTLKAGMKISSAAAENLLTIGINQHEADARRLIPKYDAYPTYVREAILNARYRGDLGPDTIKLINAGKWSKVSAEYLKHKNYTNPGSLSGVVTRMKSNAIAFDIYAAKIKSKKTTSAGTNTGMIGKVLYPRNTSAYNYATVRTSPEVNTGFINNEQVKIVWPNPIGIVDGEKMVGSNTWYRVRLPKGIGNGTGIGWVRFDVVTTDKNAKYN